MQQAIVGVDPHKRVLSAVALDGRGGRLGQWQGSATSAGIRELWAWAAGCAPGAAWAIEGSNLYGRRLALALVGGGGRRAGRVPHPHGRAAPAAPGAGEE